MILKTVYDDKNHIEKTWYDSSSVFYSEFVEHENDNFGELFVTFKNYFFVAKYNVLKTEGNLNNHIGHL